jgi:hypothetical protein
VGEIAEAWRWGGRPIPEHSPRREAFNLMLSMPRGSASAEQVHLAARAFAQREFADHAWVMVLHDHQANPHVHLSVRAESRQGRRLNPRKADLHRWREGFAHELRVLGVEAEATRQAVRGQLRRHEALWQIKAKADGRLRRPVGAGMATIGNLPRGLDANEAWRQISLALGQSERAEDVNLARAMEDLVEGRMRHTGERREPTPVRARPGLDDPQR